MRKSILFLALVSASLMGGRVALADNCGVSGNLVQNCGFETGDFTNWAGSATTDPFYNGVDTGDPLTVYPTPYQGTYEAYLGSVGGTEDLTQTITTVAGQLYSIQFAMLNDTAALDAYPGEYSNLFAASFGSDPLVSMTDVAVGPYTLYTYVATATGDSTVLDFTDENNLGSFELDAVSVRATPEPGSLVLLGTGLLGLAGSARRRLRR